ncbi:hypothetical protein AB0G86_01740 [Streptomyces scabiei]|uniref:hypothetical protein n=1 Tax=Streptomyces TaxID=1883 RepID=UPI0029ADECFA|nr:hypothetical protein [Streptomyces sp. ND04-05B]MDX3068732.1 hypothetical protein [Streptomyces sp. ND04-05B]
MRTRTALPAALLAFAALAVGCGGDAEADPAACKAAMEKQFEDAKDGKEGSRPDACDGVDEKTVRKYAEEIVADQTTKEVEKSLDDIEKDIDDTLEELETAAP